MSFKYSGEGKINKYFISNIYYLQLKVSNLDTLKLTSKFYNYKLIYLQFKKVKYQKLVTQINSN